MWAQARGNKIREKGRFLTEFGIDRLHPEPKKYFLGPGTPKKGQNQQKTIKTLKIQVLGIFSHLPR